MKRFELGHPWGDVRRTPEDNVCVYVGGLSDVLCTRTWQGRQEEVREKEMLGAGGSHALELGSQAGRCRKGRSSGLGSRCPEALEGTGSSGCVCLH